MAAALFHMKLKYRLTYNFHDTGSIDVIQISWAAAASELHAVASVIMATLANFPEQTHQPRLYPFPKRSC